MTHRKIQTQIIFLNRKTTSVIKPLIQATVCPIFGCNDNLNVTSNAATGHGLPSEVSSASIELNAKAYCNVTWSKVVSTPEDQVIGYNVRLQDEVFFRLKKVHRTILDQIRQK